MTGPLHLYPILHPKICNTISIKPKVSFLTVCKLNMNQVKFIWNSAAPDGEARTKSSCKYVVGDLVTDQEGTQLLHNYIDLLQRVPTMI